MSTEPAPAHILASNYDYESKPPHPLSWGIEYRLPDGTGDWLYDNGDLTEGQAGALAARLLVLWPSPADLLAAVLKDGGAEVDAIVAEVRGITVPVADVVPKEVDEREVTAIIVGLHLYLRSVHHDAPADERAAAKASADRAYASVVKGARVRVYVAEAMGVFVVEVGG
jgi:hypothetical protein